MDHRVAYESLVAGKIDVTELYTTDAEIKRFDLTTLEDDLHFFPIYEAVIVYRLDLEKRNPRRWPHLNVSKADPSLTIIDFNGRVQSKDPLPVIAADFIEQHFHERPTVEIETNAHRLWQLTLEHLTLVGISLGAAILFALPLGVVSAKRPRTGQIAIAPRASFKPYPRWHCWSS